MYSTHDPGTKLVFKCSPLVLLLGMESSPTVPSAGRLAARVILSWSAPSRSASPPLPCVSFSPPSLLLVGPPLACCPPYPLSPVSPALYAFFPG